MAQNEPSALQYFFPSRGCISSLISALSTDLDRSSYLILMSTDASMVFLIRLWSKGGPAKTDILIYMEVCG